MEVRLKNEKPHSLSSILNETLNSFEKLIKRTLYTNDDDDKVDGEWKGMDSKKQQRQQLKYIKIHLLHATLHSLSFPILKFAGNLHSLAASFSH